MLLPTMPRLSLRLMAVLIFLASITVASSGCVLTTSNTAFVYPRQPVYEIPKNEPLKNIPAEELAKMSPEARAAVVHNFQILTSQVVALEAVIKTHNEYANRMNETSGVYGPKAGQSTPNLSGTGK
jgi:hypothetical protein